MGAPVCLHCFQIFAFYILGLSFFFYSSSGSILGGGGSASAGKGSSTDVFIGNKTSQLASSGTQGRTLDGSVAYSSGTTAAAAADSRQSRIGDKYSKKKTAVTAFTGTGNKLA